MTDCKYYYKGQSFDALEQVYDFMGSENLNDSSQFILNPEPRSKSDARSLYDSIISAETGKITNDVLQLLTDKFQNAFPNLTFRYTNDMDADNISPDQVAFIHDGIVYVNTDKVKADSLLHEVSHIFTYVMKYINPEVYVSMINDAKNFLKDNSDIEQLLRNSYKLNDEKFYGEVVSRIMGWSNDSVIRSQLHFLRANNVEQRSEGILNSLKNTIQRFFTWVKQALHGLFGMDFNIELENASILDLAVRLNEVIRSGQKVSGITSWQVAKLMNINDAMQLNESILYKDTKSSAKTMTKKLMNSNNIKLTDEMSVEDRETYLFRKITNDSNRRLEAGIVGPAIEFRDKTDQEIRDYIKSNKLALTLNTYIPDVLVPNIINFFSQDNGGSITNIGIFGLNAKGEAVYQEKALNMLKSQMAYDKTHEIMTLSDAKRKYPQLKALDYFNDLNIIVSVEIKHKDRDNITVSLYNIDNKRQKYGRIDGIDDANILDVYGIDKKKQGQTGIHILRNDLLSINNMHLALLANEFMSNNKKVSVRQIGSIGLTPEQSHPGFIDYIGLRDNMLKMGNVESFLSDVNDELKGYFTGKKEMKYLNAGFDNIFETILDNLQNVPGWEYRVQHMKNGMLQATLGEKKKWMQKVLKELSPKTKGITHSSHNLWMVSILKDAISNIGKFNVPISEMNIGKDQGVFDGLFKSRLHMAEEPLQELTNLTAVTSMKIVKEVNDFKHAFRPIMEWFEKNGYSSFSNDYKDLFVMSSATGDHVIKDLNGNVVERELGFIYWTDDEKKDTLFGRQAKEKRLSKELLEKGDWIAEQVIEQLTDTLQHSMENDFNMYNFNTKKPYTRAEIRELLFTKWNYRKGMLPIMTKTSVKALMTLKLGQWIKKKTMATWEINSIYDEMLTKTNDNLDEVPDILMGQLLSTRSTKYGPHERLRALGITENPNSGEYEIITEDGLKRNDNITHDIETIINYLVMSSKRKIHYETDVLPVYNALRFILNDMKDDKGLNTENILNTMNMFIDRAVFGKNRIREITIAKKNILPTIQATSSLVGSLVMVGNINVGIMSTGINGIRAWSQAVANGFHSERFDPGDLLWAGGAFFANIAKVGQLLTEFQLMNMSEYELMTMRRHRVTQKNPFDQQFVNFTNWTSDMMARGMLLMAQMRHDGTWDAVEYNKEKGIVEYDMGKDERYSNMKDGETLARYKYVKDYLVLKGLMSADEEKLSQPYIDIELQSIKFDASVIVGAYENIDKANASNLLAGRMFMMFRNYLTTAFQDAFHEGAYLDVAGRIKIKSAIGVDGMEYVADWERRYIEGYVTTLFNNLATLIKTGKFSKLKQYEIENYRKLITRVAFFLAMYFLYNGLVDKDRDKEDDDHPIPDWRLVKNFRYIMSSIFVLPQVIEAVQQPSAYINIVTRGAEKLFSNFENIESVKMKDYVPSSVTTLTEPFEEEE